MIELLNELVRLDSIRFDRFGVDAGRQGLQPGDRAVLAQCRGSHIQGRYQGSCTLSHDRLPPNSQDNRFNCLQQDLGFIRAGFTARFNLEDYEHDVERAFACGRFVASHRTVRFKNPSKAWASSSSAPDIVSSSTTSVALFDDSHRITELWQVGDGCAPMMLAIVQLGLSRP